MAGNLLTPLAVWGDFTIDVKPEAELINESVTDNIIFTDVYIDGKKTSRDRVKIYARIARKAKKGVLPAILIFDDFERSFGDQLLSSFAKKGYMAILVDIAGEADGKEYYTEYPEDLAYANYVNVKSKLLQVEKDVKKTCYYEWGTVGRYVIEYLKSQACVSKIGVLGIGASATTAWHVTAMDKNVSASVFVMNAGWVASKDTFKFDTAITPEYSDNTLKYVAGIEPQSYAQHVSCPTLVLSSLNGEDYDCDRVYDTVDRIKEGVYRGVHYTQSYANSIDQVGVYDMYLFFNQTLGKSEQEFSLPSEPTIKIETDKNKLTAEVIADKEAKEVTLYYAEDTFNPVFRVWNKISECKVLKQGKHIFTLNVPLNVSLVTVFAMIKHKNGYTVSTNILAKRFSPSVREATYKTKVVYSGRELGKESLFISKKDGRNNSVKYLEQDNLDDLYRKNGPMEINGICSRAGLMTFKINTPSDKPLDDAILMFDVYMKEDGEIKVSLITDYLGTKIEYSTKASVKGGKIWNNVKLELSKFKTEEGRLLKSFDKVNAITFTVDNSGEDGTEYLINNVLWV